MKIEKFPFGYEYEVIYLGVRKLFGFDDRLVLEAEHKGRFLVIEDFGTLADFTDIDFELEDQVVITTFDDIAGRDEYLCRFTDERPWLLDRIAAARG